MLRSRLRVEKTLGLDWSLLNPIRNIFLIQEWFGLSKEAFNSHEKRLGIVNALLNPLVFQIKQHIIVC